ncbi:guanine nucleotide-binding protein G(o) subunit alpha-like [Glandiceps talaboti]
MGACLSLDEEERRARERSDAIDRELMNMARDEQNIIKILLLGAGESGKSTLVKQMKIIHHDGFTQEELLSFKPAVLDNLVSSMKFVLTGMGWLRINLVIPKNKMHAHTILQCTKCFDDNLMMRPNIANALQSLWNDKGVQLSVARGYEYELNDSASYYFESMDRICAPKYVPTATDVLRARVRTTGIIETHFKINGIIFRLYDVGGQRSERRKWIQCFDDVRALLFVAALSGYDMTLFEDPEINRLHESLRLFNSIVNNRFFSHTCMILFLNKVDLFQEKILQSGRHLRYYFPEYQGPDCDVDASARFIQYQFMTQCKNPSKVIYPHFTTATDTTNVQVVFQVVMDTIIRENLHAASLL